MERLLIIKLSSLGDVVHALPVATALRRRFPRLHLTWAVEAPYAGLVRAHPAVDQVAVLPRFAWANVRTRGWPPALRDALRTVRAQGCDVALDLQGLLKSSLVALASGARVRIGLRPQREGARFVSRLLPVPHDGLHAVDRYLAAARFLGAAPEPVDFALPVERGAAVTLEGRLAAKGVASAARLIVVNAATARREKAWPARQWAHVIDALAVDGTVVLIGTGADRAQVCGLIPHVRRPPIDLVGETTLTELVALLQRCAVHLAADTGTLHLAAALGRPVVGIYGPTHPARYGPYGQLDAVLRSADRCGRTCPRFCPRRRPCLRAVTSEDVITRARQTLRSVEG